MKNNQNETEFAEIQRLLAYKRADLPSDDYFDGVLFEFHQRQRAAWLKPRQTSIPASQLLQQWWTDLVEVVTVQPSRALRYAMGLMLSVGLLGAGLNVGRMEPTVASAAKGPVVTYALMESPTVAESTDHQIDAVSLVAASFDTQEVKAHYVLNDTATLDESIPAF